MAIPKAKRRYTPSEYYTLEHDATYKSDYHDGEIFDMSGGTSIHSQIITNTVIAVGVRLRGKTCVPYESNMRLKVEATGLRTYPGVSVYCAPLKFDLEDPRKTTALNPTVVIEVLSPTTEAYDRGLKATNYRQINSLMAYALVSADRHHVELHFRKPDGDWTIRDIDGMDAAVPLEAIGIDLPLAELYDRIDFSTED